MMTKQSFEYTGSNVYDIDNVIISNNNIAVFDQLTGIGGIGYMPYNGSTVVIKAGDNTGSFQELAPTLNNKLYYYVSDVLYGPNDSDIIRADSTEIPVIYSSGEFIGTFVFNNPNDFPYLYLFWDYNNTIDGSTNISYIGTTDERIINWTIGTGIGIAGINYNSVDTPTRFQVNWNGSVVADSGYVGLNSLTNYNDLITAGVDPEDINLVFPYDGLVNNGAGSLRFKKTDASVDTAEILVSSPISTSTWIINKVDPYLTSFYIDITDGDLINVCSQCPTTLYYHDGFNLTPQAGDIIYSDIIGATVYNGNNAYHMIDITSCTVPSPINKSYVLVDENGSVRSIDTCNCGNTAVPIITQGDIYITVNEQINIPLSSLGDPTEFNLVGTCFNYILNGGTKSSLFSYIDCNSNQRYSSVSSDIQRSICASSTPILISGDGSFENNGPCNEYLINPGMSLDSSGMLNGIVPEIKNFSFSVTATNCFGTSLPVNINVFVSEAGLIPFSVDIEQYKETSTDCCSITPSFSILYFDGKNSVPTLRDRVYRDQNSEEYFNGGEFWYFIDKSDYVIRIDNNGYVVDYSVCAGSTTTTSTTTTTTIPIVGLYYNAVSCLDNTTTATLLDITSSLISIGDVVKTQDGNCWTIDSTSAGGFPYFYIENPVVIYADCTTCTGTTTTTTSTTTTTLPPIVSFNMDDNTQFNNDYDACISGVVSSTYYFFGYSSMPLVGDIVYQDALCTIPFDGQFYWFYATDSLYNYAIQIANTGQVLHVNPCSIVTTTTTTTTIPTYYYDAEICSNPGITYLIANQNLVQFDPGTIVKCDDGICYEILASSIPGVPVANILFLFDNCSSCVGTTTTTSTSTTTTTTTTSTTTTTTTLSPTYSILLNFGSSSGVCFSPVITFYIDGPIGVPGNNIYDSILMTNLAPANYYKLSTSSLAYEWDGIQWTGNTNNC
jgi:hypothetical protein